ncbi:MAG: hypothetical protein AAF581_02150 [Planctomycetota bacterium]
MYHNSHRWLPLGSLLFVAILLLTAFLLPQTHADDEAEAPTPVEVANAYVKALANFKEDVSEEHGLRMQVKVIPDSLQYKIALEYRRCMRGGYDDYKTTKEIKKALKEHKRLADRPMFRFLIEATDPRVHYFTEKPLDKAMLLKLPKKKKAVVSEEKGNYVFATWSVDQSEGRYWKIPLGYFRRHRFTVQPTAKVRNKKDEPFEVGFVSLVKYEQPEKTHYLDRYGINATRKEIKVDEFKELPRIHPKFTFHPGSWELPKVPESLAKILEEASGKKKKKK